MTNQHLTEQEISQAAEALSQDSYKHLDSAIREHLANCDECTNETLTISTLIDSDVEKTRKQIPLLKRKFPRRLIIGLSAAACITMIIGTVIKPFEDKAETSIAKTEKSTESTVIKIEEAVNPIAKSVSIETAKEDINLLAYTPNENLEKLVDRFENSTMRSSSTHVTSSSIVKGRINDITLRWENKNKESLTFEIVDNTESIIVETSSNATSLKPQLTAPGLYYWKMYNDDFDLLFCGKIIITE